MRSDHQQIKKHSHDTIVGKGEGRRLDGESTVACELREIRVDALGHILETPWQGMDEGVVVEEGEGEGGVCGVVLRNEEAPRRVIGKHKGAIETSRKLGDKHTGHSGEKRVEGICGDIRIRNIRCLVNGSIHRERDLDD